MKYVSIDGLTPEQIAELQASIENFKKQNEGTDFYKSEFLNKCTDGSWILNEKTGLVDIKGNFNCESKKFSKEKLKDFKGVKFGVVEGDFNCDNNSLTSLEGAPQVVKGDFNCSYNKLTSLEGAPQEVEGDFYCFNNSLTSLKGAPQVVKEYFYCDDNKLTSLEGAPKVVGKSFYCSRNKLTSLEGAPQVVEEYFDCSRNKLTSLEGSPQVVKGNFYCSDNKLTSLEGAPKEVEGDFHCDDNPISEETLSLVFKTMQEKKLDYWITLSILKSEISTHDFKKREGELEKRISKDAQKGISMLNRFKAFE